VPDRELVVALAATENDTVPWPLPAPGALTAIHEALLEATHEQPSPAVTANDPEPPALAKA
jgi:hypothetical protein